MFKMLVTSVNFHFLKKKGFFIMMNITHIADAPDIQQRFIEQFPQSKGWHMVSIEGRLNAVHHTCVFEGVIQMGRYNVFGPNCLVKRNVIMGDNNYFYGFTSIATDPEFNNQFFNPTDREYNPTDRGIVKIGNNNVFREFITINSPTSTNGLTKIGDDCYIMRGSHISHDTYLGNKVTMSCNALIGGHGRIMEGAYMGLGSVIHPKLTVGAYTILGMNATLTRNAKPFSKYVGVPAENIGENSVGIERAKLAEDYRAKLLSDFAYYDKYFKGTFKIKDEFNE